MSQSRQVNLLLVEDEAIIARDEARMLAKYGYLVTIANSGETALTALRQQGNWDMVLMDLELGSGLSGPDTARKIIDEFQLPVVFLSSRSDAADFSQLEDITSYGFIPKAPEKQLLSLL